MLKQYFLITKLNLMKKTELRAIALLFSVVFFFMGMATINAQYVSTDEAILILKAEVQELETQAQNATPEEQVELAFKFHYLRFVAYDIQGGTEVGPAIENNKPYEKGQPHPSGFVTLVNAEKSEVIEVVNYVEDLLSD